MLRRIALSGYGMNSDVEKSREIGFAAHLTKPIDFPRLEALIVEILTSEKEPAKNSTQPESQPIAN